MNKRGFLMPIFCAPMLACAMQPATGARVYRPSQVVHDIEKLRGKTIRVSGYLELGPERRGLWDRSGDPDATQGRSADDAIWDHCITVYHDRAGAAAFGRVAKAMVEVIGKVGTAADDQATVDLWACNDVHITVTGVRRKHVIERAD
jgi:hypothetical protein